MYASLLFHNDLGLPSILLLVNVFVLYVVQVVDQVLTRCLEKARQELAEEKRTGTQTRTSHKHS